MLVKNKNFKYVHTMSRPDILSDEDRVYWKNIHDLIRTSEIEVEPLESFYILDRILKNGNDYMGSGFKYSLAFETGTYMKKFVKMLDDL